MRASAGKGKKMKTGFAKRRKGLPKEDITRDKDLKRKGLLGGLAITTVLLAGIAAVSLKVANKFKKES